MPLTQVNPALLDTQAQYTGFKNRIINGAMVIDQRNAGASVTLTSSNVYNLDRWFARAATGSGTTAIQSTTVPANFKNSLLITVGTGASPGASDNNYVAQRIEGLNMADFNWGTANATTVILSFWVRSSVTGTFGASIQNNALDRSYPFTYTINAANTWELKTITIPGDTTGTWLTTNGVGLVLTIDLGTGSTFQGTAGTWAASDFRAASGTTKIIATSGATFAITGVQLEKGSTATSFDYRPYGTELGLCLRYFCNQKYLVDGPAAASNFTASTGSDRVFPILGSDFKVPMRATPTVTFYSNQTRAVGKVSGYSSGTEYTVSSLSSPDSKRICTYIQLASSTTLGEPQLFYYDASAEL
jgi:hypothetical protein